jgi:hypothetical protein
LTAAGAVAVEIDEVASEKLRRQAAGALKSWFPEIDALEAERRLRGAGTILVTGVDEDSARRMVKALGAMKVGARVASQPGWGRAILNRGLAVSAISVGAIFFVSPVVAFVLVLAALGAPALGAFLKQSRLRPLVQLAAYDPRARQWAEIAEEYSRVLKALPTRAATSLKLVARTALDLRNRLGSASLAAVAAGEVSGELYSRLYDSLRAGIDLGGKIISAKEDGREALVLELESLANLMDETAKWFTAHDNDDAIQASQITQELQDIRQSIDDVIRDVRPMASEPGRRVLS